jgi:hypothetical protein
VSRHEAWLFTAEGLLLLLAIWQVVTMWVLMVRDGPHAGNGQLAASVLLLAAARLTRWARRRKFPVLRGR